MRADMTGTVERTAVRSRFVEAIYTYCAFWITLSALPALAFSFVVVRVCKNLWLKILSSRYPDLEFIRTDTVRSLLDTHRNQGIINVLLTIKGNLNVDNIKDQLIQHVIERRDKNGELTFPRLRHLLVSCWGNYAWDSSVPFRTENHFVVANNMYRGRPVTDSNIQQYVSEIISKYFPTDQPPWQYIIIPCVSTEPKYHILVRVHHLLLSGKKSINIGDLLLVEQTKQAIALPRDECAQQSPLTKLFPAPSALPELWQKMSENLSNAWNEFVSEYDPVESPRALKTLPGAFHVAGLIVISSVSALRELNKKRVSTRNENSDGPITATTLIAAIQKECKKRNLTVPKILISPLVTLNPRKWPHQMFVIFKTITSDLILLPLRVRDEVVALKELRKTGQVSYPSTLTWRYSGLAQLWGRACAELCHGVMEAYRAPSRLWTDAVAMDDGQRHLLQTISLCGRKVAAWSRPVARAGVERTARALGVSTTDVALFAATEALRAYFEQAQSVSPDTVLVTARAASQDFLFTFAEGDGKMYKKSQTGGMVCLSLPLGASPRRIASIVGRACARQRALAGAWGAQARYGAVTRALPSPLARLALNALSRRYAVSYAEIAAPPIAPRRRALWGQIVDTVVYWRPPQANISMSLTVIQYADSILLAVMTDARLSPGHTVPATRWPNAVDQLVAKVDQELARITQAIQNVPRIVTSEETRGETLEETGHPSLEASTSVDTLKPPTALESPPPLRRHLSQL